MKQRISAEQLAELTLEQREKLKKWWIPTNSLFRSMLPAFFVFLITCPAFGAFLLPISG